MRHQGTTLRAFLMPLFILAAACAVLGDTDPEPNDTIRQAVALRMPFCTAYGDIGSSADIDFYEFTAGKGQEVTVWLQTAALGSDLAAKLAFYDDDGKLLAYADRGFNLGLMAPSQDPILYLRIPSAGTYYLSVSSVVNSGKLGQTQAATKGKYALAVFHRFDGPAIGDVQEPNDSMEGSTAAALPFRTYGANLIYLGDLDWYEFKAVKGERISIDVDALEFEPASASAPSVHTRVGLFDRTGALLAEAAQGDDPDTGFSGDPALTYEVQRDGTYYVCVTLESDGQYLTLFGDPDFLADPYVDCGQKYLGYYQLSLRTLHDLYFPQIANGSFGGVFFRTTILLLNNSRIEATGSVSLFGADGAPLETSFTPGGAESNSAWFSIPPRGSLIVRTGGSGPGTSGYALVRATAPVGASAVFSQYDPDGQLVTEAGLGSVEPVEFFTFPVDVTGEYNTGLAVANISAGLRANLYMRLVNGSGSLVSTKSLSLDPGKQISLFVSGAGQLFPGITNFRGSLQVMADAPIVAVALRSSARTLTTLPPAGLNQPFQSVTMYFPQVVLGSTVDRYRSTIVLTNPGYFTVSGSIRFTGSDGRPMAVGIGPRVSSEHVFAVPPQGTVFLESDVPASLATGHAVVTANHAVGGAIIYSRYSGVTGKLQAEVAVSSAERHTDFLLFAQSDGEYNTGLALANPGPDGTALDYALQPNADPATVMQKGPVPLLSGEQRSELVAGIGQIFPDFNGDGTLEVVSTQPVPAVALRLTARTMTALPVIPVK